MATKIFSLKCSNTQVLESGGCDHRFDFETAVDLKLPMKLHYKGHHFDGSYSGEFRNAESFETRINDQYVDWLKSKHLVEEKKIG